MSVCEESGGKVFLNEASLIFRKRRQRLDRLILKIV